MEVNLLPNVAKFQADKVNFSRKMVGVTMTIAVSYTHLTLPTIFSV